MDFACWGAYKYLNGSAGGLAGIFVHSHCHDDVQPAFEGWWSHRFHRRFAMDRDRELCKGARAFRISNPPPLLVAPLIASLELFREAGEERLLQKQYLLTGYLYELIGELFGDVSESTVKIKVLTPHDPQRRGCQLSLRFSVDIDEIYAELEKHGVVVS